MRRRGKLIFLSVCVIVCAFFAAFSIACNNHKHEFSDDWEYDGTHHWHEAVCHKGAVSEKAEHNMVDKVCTVCGYTTKLTYDMSGVVFEDLTVTYDGKAHSIMASNLPEGVDAIYTGNEKTDAGTYTVTAIFFGDTENYMPIPSRTATLRIKKATYDMSGVEFVGEKVVKYDEAEHSLTVKNVPDGVSVTYLYNNKQLTGVTEAGEYTVTARFKGDQINYESIPDMTEKLTITREKHYVTFVQKGEKDIIIEVLNLASLEGDDIPQPKQTPGYKVEWNADDLKKLKRITSNVTVHADEPVIADYVINYHLDGADNAPGNPETYTMFEQEDITLLDPPARLGYNFGGWYRDENFVNAFTSIKRGSYGDIDVYAKWTAIIYNITYYLEGGVNDASNPATYTVLTPTITFAKATREGYTFAGWFADSDFSEEITELPYGSVGALELYAKWVRGSEGLTFELTGNSYSVTGYTGGSASVVIPDEWEHLPVSAVGDGAFYNNQALESVEIPSSIVSIGANAFMGCNKLLSMVIPDSVTEIGNGAFVGCNQLVVFAAVAAKPDGWSDSWIGQRPVLFNYGGEKGVSDDGVIWGLLKNGEVTVLGRRGEKGNIVIPASFNSHPVTLIMDRAFASDGNLSRVEIAGELLTIGAEAFRSCINLTGVVIGEGVLTIGEKAFDGCVKLAEATIASGVATIDENAFYGCGKLKDIAIPASVTYIGESAFVGCTNLIVYVYGASEPDDWQANWIDEERPVVYNYGGKYGEVTDTAGCSVRWALLNDGTAAIASFSGNISNPVIPSKVGGYTVSHIAGYAFNRLTALQHVNIPSEVTSIAQYAFNGCNNIISIGIPFVGGEKNSAVNTSFGYIFGLANADLPSALKTVVISGGDEIYGSAFGNCKYITAVAMSDSVTTIGANAFFNCNRLSNLTIGRNVYSIGSYAFYSCYALTEVTIPDGVAFIASNAFENCTKVAKITIGKGVNTIGENAFANCPALKTVEFNAENCTVMSYVQGGGIAETSVFAACAAIDTLIIGKSVRTIPDYAFYGCANISDLTIKSGITSIGAYAFLNCSAFTSLALPDSLETIGAHAFHGCSAIGELSLGEGVMTIGEYAFYNCTALNYLVIPDSVLTISESAFDNCMNVETIVLGAGIMSIDENAFYMCETLKTVYYHAGLGEWSALYSRIAEEGNEMLIGAKICLYSEDNPYDDDLTEGNYWHYNDDGDIVFWPEIELRFELNEDMQSYYVKGVVKQTFTEIEIPATYRDLPVTAIGTLAFDGCALLERVTVPASVRLIGEYAFNNCSSLAVVSGLGGVTEIGNYAFTGCAALSSITLSTSILRIGDYAFNGCGSLTGIKLPEGLQIIGAFAFNKCSTLAAISIPASVTQAGTRLFADCVSLSSITVASGNTVYKGEGNCLIVIATKTLFSGCSSSVIPANDSVTRINSNAFNRRTGLKTIHIPANITEIGDHAFAECTALRTVTFESGVTSIGDNAFYNCKSLVNVYLPDSVDSIGMFTFFGCAQLESVVIGKNVTMILGNTFYGCTNLTTVYYGGSEEQWNELSIGANNGAIENADIYYYSESAPQGSGNYWHYDQVSGLPTVWRNDD